MAIPETQLDTWSKQGSVAGSSSTYNTIKIVLEETDSPYYAKNFDVFLQGSYGNDTNVYAESDVDIVIQLKSSFQHDLSQLSENQKMHFNSAFSNSSYGYHEFKDDVLKHLVNRFGTGVKAGNKAISIPATANRRKADVIVALEYRRYTSFHATTNQSYIEGIKFYTSSGQEIINYPKKHSQNLTRKHQDSANWLKPVVRILKNLRSRLEDKGRISTGDAPSYYLEGLLYNVPSEKFGTSYGNCFCNAISWIQQANRSNFVCPNEQYYLLRSGSNVSWDPAKCDAFLGAAVELWNNW